MQERIAKKIDSSYPEISKIGEDLTSLKADVGALVGHVKEDGMRDIAEATSGAYSYAGDMCRKIEKQVREQPAKSIAIAFAGGLLVSLFLGRR